MRLVVLICMHKMILNIFGIHDTDQDKDGQIIVFSAILLLNLAYLFSSEFHFNTWCQMLGFGVRSIAMISVKITILTS